MTRKCFGWTVLGLLAVPAVTLADTTAGAKVFNKECQTCHSVTSDQSSTGPSLHNIVGRKAAALENWDYSKALKASNLVWTPDTLEKWLADPHGKVPETDMPYPGLKDPAQRKALVEYLQKASGK